MKSEGRVTGESLRQLTAHGIPILAQLAAQFGVNEQAVRKMVEEGQVGFPQLQAAFAAMTGPGGRFAGLMEKQSHTLAGLWSSLRDTVGMTLAGVVTTIADSFNLRGGISSLTAGLGTIGERIPTWVAETAPKVKAVGIAVYDTFASIYGYVAPVLSQVVNVVRNGFGEMVAVVEAVAPIIWTTAVGAFETLYSAVAPTLTALYEAVAGNWESILDVGVSFGTSLITAVAEYYAALGGMALELWGGITAAWTWGVSLITGQNEDAHSGA